MSIESIPAESILQIFSYLPLKDLVRVGGVNRLFNQLSREAIDHLKSLELSDDVVKYCLRSYPFWKLLESCSPELERIKSVQPCSKELFEILSEFTYPKLAYLEFAIAPSLWLDTDRVQSIGKCLVDLVERNENIRSMILRFASSEVQFSIDMIFDRLENLEIQAVIDNDTVLNAVYESSYATMNYDELLRSLTGGVPNLKRLAIQTWEDNGAFLMDGTNGDMDTILNRFIKSVPNLKSLRLVSGCRDLIRGIGIIDGYSHMWNLSSLVDLRLDLYNESGFVLYDQAVVTKISTSFPRLQTFITRGIQKGDMVLVLKELKHLRKLCLPRLDIEKSIFIEILASFPSLQQLEIRRVEGVSSIASFLSVLSSIVTNKKIEIKIGSFDRSIWDAENVKMVVEEMKNSGGPIIEIKELVG